MDYPVQNLHDGRIVIQDRKNNQHKYINTPTVTHTFENLTELFDWLERNAERVPWIPNHLEYD
jgi:hypothetical protein